jgi:hypothetical protein
MNTDVGVLHRLTGRTCNGCARVFRAWTFPARTGGGEPWNVLSVQVVALDYARLRKQGGGKGQRFLPSGDITLWQFMILNPRWSTGRGL